MNIKQIRYFVAVFDSGSLSSAAKREYVTVQAISKAIGNLEEELKGDLFYRESRGVRATPLGRNFYLRAVAVLREFDKLENFAHSYREKTDMAVLYIALATPPFYGNDKARAHIASFIGHSLGIKTVVTLELPSDAMDGLRSGRLDAVIMVGKYNHPEFDCMSIGTVAPSVIMSPHHPLVQKETVRLDDIRSYPILFSPGHDDFYDSIVAAYHRREEKLMFTTVLEGNFDSFLEEEYGLAFAACIPSLGSMHPWAEQRLIAQEDTVATPICLVSPKNNKSPLCMILAQWLANEFILLAGNTWGKVE